MVNSMRYLLGAPLLAAFAFAAQANPISTIYAFGDSLSDVGNTAIAVGIPAPPYVNGHFSNGQIWVQDLAASLKLAPVTPSLAGGNDFAVGGALSGSSPFYTASPLAGDLPYQIAAFHAAHPVADPNALYTLWIGSNDLSAVLASNPSSAQAAADVAAVVGNIDTALSALAADGAKNVLVVDVPDLGKTPRANAGGPLAQAAGSGLSGSLDSLLVNGSSVAGIPSLASLASADALSLNVLDAYSLLDGIVAHPALYGFSDVTDACLTGEVNYAGGVACSNPNQYLFWDDVHPTAAGHALVAAGALAVVTPEPAALGAVSLGLLLLFTARRFRAA